MLVVKVTGAGVLPVHHLLCLLGRDLLLVEIITVEAPAAPNPDRRMLTK